MFHILIFLLLIGFIFIVVILLSVFGFFRVLLGGGRKRQAQQDIFGRQQPSPDRADLNKRRNREKVIPDGEGEYVDYEEIK